MMKYQIIKIDEAFHQCAHLNRIKQVKVGNTGVCEECIRLNTEWVHLRTCQTCGITLCCDDSPEQHMTRLHHRQTQHPVIASAQEDERWLYCYTHDVMAEY